MARMHYWRYAWVPVAFAAVGLSPARAQETTIYTYDVKGRVVTVTRSGGPANGTITNYAYDAVDNRSNVTVTNSPNGTGGNDAAAVATVSVKHHAVVPLNGYALISIKM